MVRFWRNSLQPSEFAKFATSLALAAYLNNRRQELTRMRVLIPALAIIALPAILILIQPDMGSAIVFSAFFIVFFREGMSPYIFVSGLLAILFFFLTLILGSTILSASLVVTALVIVGIISRKWKTPGKCDIRNVDCNRHYIPA